MEKSEIEKCSSQCVKKKILYVSNCRTISANDDYDYDECVHPSSKFSLSSNFCINSDSYQHVQYNPCNEYVFVSFRLGISKTHVNRWKFDFFFSPIPRWKICQFFLWFVFNLKWEITAQHYTDFYFFFFFFFLMEIRQC